MRLILPLLALLGCGPHTRVENAGAAEPLPAADTLIAKAIEASGGATARDAVQSVRSSGTVMMPAQGIQASILMLQQSPDYVYTRMELTGLGVLEEGVIDGVAWANDPIGGPRIKSGEEAAQAIHQADLHIDSHLDEHYSKIETTGRGTAGPWQVWEVTMIPRAGGEEIALIDVETGRRVGARLTAISSMGPIPMSMVYLDFKEVAGVTYPVRVQQVQGALSTELILDKIEVNPADFARVPLPEDISALIEAQPANPAASP